MNVIMGRRPDGTYREVAVNINGELRIETSGAVLTTISGVKDQAGSNVLVNPPDPGYRHLIRLIQFQCEEAPAGAFQRVLLKSGSTELWRFVGTKIESGLTQSFDTGNELPCDEAQAISIDLAEAKDVGYVIRYRTEAMPT